AIPERKRSIVRCPSVLGGHWQDHRCAASRGLLARAHPEARVLLTTFSDALSNALRTKLRGLISNDPRLAERLEVNSMNAVGRRLYEGNIGRPRIASRET